MNQSQPAEKQTTDNDINKLLYTKNYTCPLCSKKFSTQKPRHSRLKLIKEHGDFFKEYESINPSYYLVNVCNHCGYAYTDQFDKLQPAQKEQLEEKVAENWHPRDYGGIRDDKMALEALKLAILCGQIQGVNYNILCTLLLHTAWIYRELKDDENEKRFLFLAKEYFLKLYQEDSSGDTDIAKLLYLLGELSRRLENYNEAVSWFSKLVSDKKTMDQKLINRAREQWMDIKKKKERKNDG